MFEVESKEGKELDYSRALYKCMRGVNSEAEWRLVERVDPSIYKCRSCGNIWQRDVTGKVKDIDNCAHCEMRRVQKLLTENADRMREVTYSLVKPGYCYVRKLTLRAVRNACYQDEKDLTDYMDELHNWVMWGTEWAHESRQAGVHVQHIPIDLTCDEELSDGEEKDEEERASDSENVPAPVGTGAVGGPEP